MSDGPTDWHPKQPDTRPTPPAEPTPPADPFGQMAGIGVSLHEQFRALVDGGFTPAQALTLIGTMLGVAIANGQNGGQPS